MPKKLQIRLLVLLSGGFFVYSLAEANNIQVGGATIVSKNNVEMYAIIQFDISWENSWRNYGETGSPTPPYNWDAAWVFIKYRANGGVWGHAWLHDQGHTPASGSLLEIGLLQPGAAYHPTSNPGAGVFISRSTIAQGNVAFDDVMLRWNYGANGLTNEDVVDIVVYAVETVYISQGSFYLGTGGNETGSFTNGNYNKDQVVSFTVTNQGAGYTSVPDVIIDNEGSGGAGASAVAVLRPGFPVVNEVLVVSSGSGYTSPPTVTLDGGGGTGATATAHLGTINQPLLISGEGEIDIGRAPGSLWGTDSNPVSRSGIGSAGTLPSDFPKGFRAFYCMKHEITQQNYVDFLNSLTTAQATSRFSNQSGNYRHAITVNGGVYSTSLPDVACNYLSWSDVAAILDWMALRPMTELEYEKACRGMAAGTANEYPWGNTTATDATSISNSGASNEIPGNSTANSAYAPTGVPAIPGPLRVGAFAKSATTRAQSGATYFGIMEMGGNIREWVVSIVSETGRYYTGLHGDGLIDPDGGVANVSSWPAGSEPEGIGMRGGDWHNAAPTMRTSDRDHAAQPNSRQPMFGGRGVRTAP
jgi:formylglycine-generating enzyme required for sulfatase activity